MSRHPIDELADTLSSLRTARAEERQRANRFWDRLLLPPKRIRPMGLIATQMSVNPFEIVILVSLLCTGLAYIVLPVPPPNSIAELLPTAAVWVWSINLTIGSLLALFGGLWRGDLEVGLGAYQVGWVLAAVACLVYGVAIFVVHPIAGIFPATLDTSFALACLIRVIQVQRFFRLTRALVRGQLSPPPIAVQWHDGEDGSWWSTWWWKHK